MAGLSIANGLDRARFAHRRCAGRDGGHFAAMFDLGHRNFGGTLVVEIGVAAGFENHC
jgi:hypothetical protein